MDGTKRSSIKIGKAVLVVQKQDQRTGKLTERIVKKILINSSDYPRVIKVIRYSEGCLYDMERGSFYE